MKRVIALCILFGAVLWAVDPWTGDIGPVHWWVMDNTSPGTNLKFRGICVINDSLAWVVGEAGKVRKRTGGVHSHEWQDIYVPNATKNHFNDVCFVSPDMDWIVGEKRHDYMVPESRWYEGIVYKTTDGGTNWDSVPITPQPPIPTPFLKVQMVQVGPDYHGYIACGNGVVLKTDDGGATWSRCKTPYNTKDSISVWYNGLKVINSNNLWVSGDAFGTALQFDATDFSGFKQIKYPYPLASAIICSYRT